MACTHLSLHYHLVFSTKERFPYITIELRDQLYSYIGGIIKTLGGIPETIDGIDDHIHILIGLKATHRLADVLREIKCVSSKWVHEELKKNILFLARRLRRILRQRIPNRKC